MLFTSIYTKIENVLKKFACSSAKVLIFINNSHLYAFLLYFT